MKKESKNLGVRRECATSSCKGIVVKDINLTGTGYFVVKCLLCLKFTRVVIGEKTHVIVRPEFKGLKIAGRPIIGTYKI